MSPINFSINEAHYSLNENEMSSPVGSSEFGRGHAKDAAADSGQQGVALRLGRHEKSDL